MDVAALIPAYNPDRLLVGLVQEMQRSGRLAEIIVVNDGSGEECRPIFTRLAAIPGVTVLHHAVNLGKGAALKTGLNHFCFAMPQGSGVVTADADGQHLPADVLRVAARLEETGDRLVLGSREFAGGVPLRSRLGNACTKYAFWGLIGKKLEDTQSGLRGIPQALARQLLRAKNSGYEFELDMLVHCRRTGVPIEACPIATVYLDENRSSHFHPLFDSLRIYYVLLRFIAASLATAAVDFLVFSLVFAGMANILAAQAAARLAAVGVNFVLARQAVFRSRRLDLVAGEVSPPRGGHGNDFVLPHPHGDARLRLERAAGENGFGVDALSGQFRRSAGLHLRRKGEQPGLKGEK